MSVSFINNLSSSSVQPTVANSPPATGLLNSSASTAASTSETQPDNSQLSPLARILVTLQQLQESNPTQYQEVTKQIATNLQNAAQTATAEGNTGAATQLNQLASDFTDRKSVV